MFYVMLQYDDTELDTPMANLQLHQQLQVSQCICFTTALDTVDHCSVIFPSQTGI